MSAPSCGALLTLYGRLDNLTLVAADQYRQTDDNVPSTARDTLHQALKHLAKAKAALQTAAAHAMQEHSP